MRAALPLLLAACAAADTVGDDANRLQVGSWTVEVGDDGVTATRDGVDVPLLEALTVDVGAGTQTIEERTGAYLFSDVETLWQRGVAYTLEAGDGSAVVQVSDEQTVIATLTFTESAVGGLRMTSEPRVALDGTPRLRLAAACGANPHFLGAGSHAQDVDHVGEAFPLWTSEQGVGKTTDDAPPDNWFLVGTKHASSYPVPWLLRPELPAGILVDTTARVEVDLCASDPDRFAITTWTHTPVVQVLQADTPLAVVQTLSDVVGRPRKVPDWALGPWVDAIKGTERVQDTLDWLLDEGVPTAAIWTEDWKGAEPNFTGYRLSKEWFADRELYDDLDAQAAQMDAAGIQWLAYFAPFLAPGTTTWDEAVEADVLVKDAEGAPYEFIGAAGKSEGLIDPTAPGAEAWMTERFQAAVDLGFRGWMVDFAEWLPVDAVLADGTSGLLAHNDYPRAWQAPNEAVLAAVDGVPFCRSGWVGAQGVCPVAWVGDQATDDSTGDGFPTVVPLMLGLSTSGTPVSTHDIGGYQSFGTTTRSAELWRRWAALGVFSPIMRTHHGSSTDANHQFDSDEGTRAVWAHASRLRQQLFPYLSGLTRRAAEDGTPMVLPTAFVVDDAWSRTDAFLLGDALLVAPITETDATSRQVDLPNGATWWAWSPTPADAPATSGVHAGRLDVGEPAEGFFGIPVFARGGTVIPLLAEAPQTLVRDPADADVTGLDDVDGERIVQVFGDGGTFTEGDGTTYTVTGSGGGSGTATGTFVSGTIDLGGRTLAIEGPVERTYTVIHR